MVCPPSLIVIGVILLIAKDAREALRPIRGAYEEPGHTSKKPRRFRRDHIARLLAQGYPTKEDIAAGASPRFFTMPDVDCLYPYIEEIWDRLSLGDDYDRIARDIADEAGYRNNRFPVIRFVDHIRTMGQEGRMPPSRPPEAR